MEQLILPALLLLLFLPLILSFRRQRRQFSQMQQLQSSLNVGDQVMTTSGLKATILATADDTVDLEIAPGVVTTWVRQAIRERVDDTPAAIDDADADDSANDSADHDSDYGDDRSDDYRADQRADHRADRRADRRADTVAADERDRT